MNVKKFRRAVTHDRPDRDDLFLGLLKSDKITRDAKQRAKPLIWKVLRRDRFTRADRRRLWSIIQANQAQWWVPLDCLEEIVLEVNAIGGSSHTPRAGYPAQTCTT
jgi:hypothetical protein